MKFIPCLDKCTYEGAHCEGCGRSHEEIAETKKLVKDVVEFVQQQQYENMQEFVTYFGNKVLSKLQDN